ncbi:MAG TPA: hypothetical protein DCZ91_24405 [Lachnospiraceae bacterium]|nr:hypothetical protein [Lachnospiraceae bacterium]
MKGRRKRGKIACALSAGLAALFCVLAAGPGTAYGAAGIDTSRTDCRIDFTLDVDTLSQAGETGNLETVVPNYNQYYGELVEFLKGGGDAGPGTPGGAGSDTGDGTDSSQGQRAIRVNLYKIADVDAGGHYKLLPGYTSSDTLKGVEAASADTTAAQWSGWAVEASRMAVGTAGEDGNLQPPAAGGIQPDAGAEITLQDGKASGAAENLAVGLYLVSVEPVETADYRYSFIPYLISLPGRSHGAEGEDGDEWIYGDEDGRIYVGLKPEREDRLGDLILEKKIDAYNETSGGVSFIFEVKAVKDDRVVYNDLVSLTFDASGTQTARIEKLPAGAEVTVTEIYCGAGYAPVDGIYVKNAVITAEGAVRVTFENRYGGTPNGGNTSVVNHFVYAKDEAGGENLQWEKREGESHGTAENAGN